MKTNKVFMLFMFLAMISCKGTIKQQPENWNDDQLNTWFNTGEWRHKWAPLADETINRKEFAIQYFKNKDRWDKAFSYLSSINTDTLRTGITEIMGKDVYVSVTEYMTKNDEDARIEAHRRYADIQYVVRGKEKIGIIPLGSTEVTIPYDQEKDIVFLNAEGGTYKIATPDNFFIFLPADAHRPSMKIDTSSFVKKLVVKIKLD